MLSLPGIASPLPVTLFLNRAPRSYTGEDLIELHTIGSPPILECALARCIQSGARQAIPGEFTMRAFLNSKLDLTAAEAVLGLIDASNSRQAEIALRQLAGGIARPITRLRDELLDLLADLEAGLDFVEEDLDFIDRPRLRATLHRGVQQLAELDRQMNCRTLYVDRPRVILAGPPNAGKSSLFNALLGVHAALVSPAAGTTRDYLTAQLNLPSCTVELIDTAGIDQARDAIGQLSQAARDNAVAGADLILWCQEVSNPNAHNELPTALADCSIIQVHTKSDLSQDGRPDLTVSKHRAIQSRLKIGDGYPIAVSSHTGAGLNDLRIAIDGWLNDDQAAENATVASTATRCRNAIAAAASAMNAALTHVEASASDELVAVEIRTALDELGQVVGAVYTDDILDRLFSRFCIGK
jgi:tRNA modification GTPase